MLLAAGASVARAEYQDMFGSNKAKAESGATADEGDISAIGNSLFVEPAPVAQGGVVRNIIVEGNQRVERETALSYLTFRAGDNVTDEEISHSLKQLFETGLFADVKITRRGEDIVVTLSESPIISQVAFEGNKRIKDDELEKETSLKSRSIFSRAKVQSDVERIMELYRKNGRFSATVTPKIIERGQNRIDLVYEISEGPETKVQKIFFVGNDSFKSDVLRKTIKTAEERWYKFFTSDDNYDPDRMAYDQELLRRFYMERGHADFQVLSAVAELSPEKDGFYITFCLSEGEKYKFGKIGIESKMPDVKPEALRSLLQVKEGERYNGTKIEDSVDALVKALGDEGFAFIDVKPVPAKNAEAGTVDMNFIIGEGPRVYVERIDIHGNVRTLDSVIRREFRLAEGDPFSTSKLKRTEQRLNNLGYFEAVKIHTAQGSAPDRAIIDVEVQEKSTGELSFGAGFSSVDGLLGEISLKENNLLGKGQILKLRTTLASTRQEVDLGFTEPYFLNRDLAAGVDVYRTLLDYRTQSSFDQDTKGFNLRTSYPLTENLRHSLVYTLRSDDITNIRQQASRFIREQEGLSVTSLVGHSLLWDHRDNKFDPTEGYYMKFSQDLAGLGGDSHFLRNEIYGSVYYPLAKEWVSRIALTSGYIYGISEDVAIKDRFFVGGNNFRGFKRAGIGPRDITTTDSLGGNAYYVGTFEQSFPLGLPQDLGFSGVFFVDAGSLWDIDATGPEIDEANGMRVSLGLGVYWRSPFGPIRIDFGEPIKKNRVDEVEKINFSFGTRF